MSSDPEADEIIGTVFGYPLRRGPIMDTEKYKTKSIDEPTAPAALLDALVMSLAGMLLVARNVGGSSGT